MRCWYWYMPQSLYGRVWIHKDKLSEFFYFSWFFFSNFLNI
jgi:hypothetical protein